MLTIDNLHASVGDKPILKGLSLHIPAGEIHVIMGPNGAGKSTLIALLTRLYDLQGGDIHVGGHSLREAPREALRQLGVVFQQTTLDLDLSVEQNLRYHAALHGLSRRQTGLRVEAELERQTLGERRREKVRELNGGHRRRVEIARALLHEPRLLLLDEASVGLDPASRLALNQHLRTLCREQGLSVLWTTHLLDEVQADDTLMILHQGRLVASGQLDTLLHEQGDDLGGLFARLTRAEVAA